MITSEQEKRFSDACDAVIGVGAERSGIGTLGEKTLHAVIKRYIEPREELHEVKCKRFVCDIKREDGIYEVQTRSFGSLGKKLEAFLPEYDVTVVYPLPHIKWLCWINTETSEVTPKRKSPKKGAVTDSFRELYRIKQYLDHPHFHLKYVLLELVEYRYLDGWSNDGKKGSTRCDRLPERLIDEVDIISKDDYYKLIPDSLPEVFTAKDFARSAKITDRSAGMALGVLKYLDKVVMVGKEGNRYLYEVKKQ